jgi:hypothetical protein
MKGKKQVVMALVVAVLCVGMLSAKSTAKATKAPRALPASEIVSVSGNLQFVEGMIAVVSDGKTYYVSGIQRLSGFVDGLKEGAAVRLEGSATAVPLNADARFLRVTKLTFNGKTYDFPATAGGHWR